MPKERTLGPDAGKVGDVARRKRFDRGRWLVERERHRIAKSEPDSDFADSSAIDDILPGLMKRLGIEQRHWEVALQEEWESIVGSAVAAHTRPGRLVEGLLTVFVDSAVWLDQLKRYSRRLHDLALCKASMSTGPTPSAVRWGVPDILCLTTQSTPLSSDHVGQIQSASSFCINPLALSTTSE